MTTAADLRRVLADLPDDTPVDRFLELLRAEVAGRPIVQPPRRAGARAVLEAASLVLAVPLPCLLERPMRVRHPHAWQRQIAAYALRRAGHSYPEIAEALGWSCHTSAIDAHAHVAQLVDVDPRVRELVEEIARRAVL